jgi:hypothetical protein
LGLASLSNEAPLKLFFFFRKKDGYDGTGIISYSPDHDYFFHLATTYANNHKTMRDGCVPGEFKNGVTNGAEWYNVRGE